jgi:hypothetical protein
MIRNIKALGLAFVAVAAMSMAAASAVQASELHATHPGDVVITGSQIEQHKFQITHPNGPNTNCTAANFEGTVPWSGVGQQVTSNDVTVTATYSQCKSFGLNATVRMNGCKYTITGKANTNTGATTALTSYVDITCPTAGKQIEVIAGGGACVITVPGQHNLQHIVFSNTTEAGKPHHTHANITITGITYQTHGEACLHEQTVTRSDAQYTGQATFRAFKKLGQHQVTEHLHQFEKQTHAEQVGLLAT